MYLPHWPNSDHRKDINLGLNRIQELLLRLGNPHLSLPPTIHVAGTNGKGSTIAYLKSILEESGYSVHRYISPHLVHFNERICVAGKDIEDDFLYELLEECRCAAKELQVTFFEGTTAAAFLAFTRVKADVLLLETGLGGRLDATNVIPSPLLSIITPISFDHVEYLGDMLAKIASEKAGIIKPGSYCIMSQQPTEVMQVLQKHCQEQGVRYLAYGEHWEIAQHQTDSGFVLKYEGRDLPLPLPSLFGRHQIMNAATAAMAMLYGFHVSQQHLECGLTHAAWPGRMQKVLCGKLGDMIPSGSELWLDGAHNLAGATVLAESIEQMSRKLPLYLIHGRSKGRDIREFLQVFAKKVSFFCAAETNDQSLLERASNVHSIAIDMGFKSHCSDSIEDALRACLAEAKGQDVRIVVCGSLYLVGGFLQQNG